MGSSSGSKKPKKPEKQYVVDTDSDEDDIDLSFLDFSKETFVPPPNLLEDPFLNLLCDEKMLMRSINAMGDEQNGPDVNQADHAHMDEENQEQVGRDADNHVYPIAWAVVNVENADN